MRCRICDVEDEWSKQTGFCDSCRFLVGEIINSGSKKTRTASFYKILEKLKR